MWRAIIWTNDVLVYWHIYASFGFNESDNGLTPIMIQIDDGQVYWRMYANKLC